MKTQRILQGAGPAFLAVATFAIAMLCTILSKGPWYDEFYTYFVAQPTLPLGQAVFAHWLPDNHPPLFYAVARAFWWLGASIEHKRLLNLAVFVATIGAGVALVWPRPDLHRLTAIYALVLSSQQLAVRYSSDYRSYFSSLCAISLLILALAAVHTSSSIWRRRDTVLLWVAAIVSFNLHIATSIIAAAVQLPFLVLYLARGDTARFWRIAVPSAAGGLLFTATSAIQAQFWLANTEAFWLPAGWGVARWTLEMTLVKAAQANVALLVASLMGFALVTVTSLRQRRWSSYYEMAAMLVVGASAAIAIILAVHAWRPFIFERYLLGLIPIVAMGIALGVEELLARFSAAWTSILLAICAVLAGVSASGAALEVQQSGEWTSSAAFVARIVAECPAAPVHTDPFWNADVLALPPHDNQAVVPFAYRMMAERYGFTTHPPGSRRVGQVCPTVVWAEAVRPERWPATDVLQRMKEQGFPVSRITVYYFGRSFVAIADPQPQL